MDLPHSLQHSSDCSPEKNIELTADEKLWNTLSDTETDDLLDDTSENRIEKLREALDRLPADERALITFFYEEEKISAK